MMSRGLPLRYKISSWRQLPQCLSNNSSALHIRVTDFINNEFLRGFRISVVHETYGTLFACVLHARGTIITEAAEYGAKELQISGILAELEKYGFLITYAPNEKLPGGQLEYLATLRHLGYDKIRILNVWSNNVEGTKEWAPKVVAFSSKRLGDWLNNAYSPHERELYKALIDGSAANLTEICKTKKYRWDWLDFVANIDDVLCDNADDLIRIPDPNEE